MIKLDLLCGILLTTITHYYSIWAYFELATTFGRYRFLEIWQQKKQSDISYLFRQVGILVWKWPNAKSTLASFLYDFKQEKMIFQSSLKHYICPFLKKCCNPHILQDEIINKTHFNLAIRNHTQGWNMSGMEVFIFKRIKFYIPINLTRGPGERLMWVTTLSTKMC